jgi:phosphopantothenoylcysteine decarboxylase/phosphopantothenate--cysteine ligase
MLACGYEGVGRLANIDTIYQTIIETVWRSTALSGKKILITSGGTMEPIDDVRFISNRSSGKMGAALADECYKRGAEVILLRAKNAVSPRYTFRQELFTTTHELEKLLRKYIPTVDICYHVAAVSDFTVANKKQGKISSSSSVTLQLDPQKKLLHEIKRINPRISLIGFKAESEPDDKKLVQSAKQKLEESHADIIVANDVSGTKPTGFEVDSNEVYIVTKKKTVIHIPLASKRVIASRIVDEVTTYLSMSQ